MCRDRCTDTLPPQEIAGSEILQEHSEISSSYITLRTMYIHAMRTTNGCSQRWHVVSDNCFTRTLVVYLAPFLRSRPNQDDKSPRANFSGLPFCVHRIFTLLDVVLAQLFSLVGGQHASRRCRGPYSRVAAKDTLPPDAAAAAASRSVGGSGAGGNADVSSIVVGGIDVVVVGQSLPTP